MKDGKVKINVFMVLLYIILILPFFKITYFTVKYPIFNTFYNVLLFFSLIITLILMLRKKTYSKIINYILLFFIVLIFSTYINSADVESAVMSSVKAISMCLLFDYALRNDKYNFTKGISIYLTIIVLINFLTILMYPKGMYVSGIDHYTSNWFLGFKNMHILYILPAILFNFLDSYYKKNKISFKNYLFTFICLLSTTFSNSGTAIIGVAIVFLFMLFKNMFSNTKVFNIKNYFIFNIVLFFSVVILRLQNLFKFLIVDVLKRDMTFTGRIYIWDYVIDFIKSKPFLGYGTEVSTIRYYKTYFNRSLHAHNQFLEIIYKTGLIGFIIFIILFIVCLKKSKELPRDNILVKLVSIILLSFMIVMLTEAYAFEYFIYLFVIYYDLNYLLEGSDSVEN